MILYHSKLQSIAAAQIGRERSAVEMRGVRRRRFMDLLIYPGELDEVTFCSRSEHDAAAAAELASRPHWGLEIVEIQGVVPTGRRQHDRILRKRKSS